MDVPTKIKLAEGVSESWMGHDDKLGLALIAFKHGFSKSKQYKDPREGKAHFPY